ncbi:hypothetical protein [Roseicitreum antarcticum]|uniref:Secreted protein n=1 Tax=Roseicitreum antarcticum TaxID=564137 RepID=A0A1H2RH33_9RHOB|nr:hypothetical protein [Roseicitreum antarcticum]SDW18772.1 hypothetical protein SAMN04488238_101315 [Roseicitreum antarcticum]
MKNHILAVTFATLSAAMAPTFAAAGPIENACNSSERPQAHRALCRCIDSIADMTLTRSEQRQVARFFSDPQRAQDVRMSKTTRDNELWARYRAFGDLAEARCAG